MRVIPKAAVVRYRLCQPVVSRSAPPVFLAREVSYNSMRPSSLGLFAVPSGLPRHSQIVFHDDGCDRSTQPYQPVMIYEYDITGYIKPYGAL